MTRDEAIECLWVPSPPQSWAVGKGDAADMVDRLAALGVLTLDEPKCPTERAVDAMFSLGVIHGGMITPRHAIQAIASAGLKIMEK